MLLENSHVERAHHGQGGRRVYARTEFILEEAEADNKDEEEEEGREERVNQPQHNSTSNNCRLKAK